MYPTLNALASALIALSVPAPVAQLYAETCGAAGQTASVGDNCFNDRIKADAVKADGSILALCDFAGEWVIRLYRADGPRDLYRYVDGQGFLSTQKEA